MIGHSPPTAGEDLIRAVADEFGETLRLIRRDLHAHPELAFEEHRTAALIRERLTEWGIPIVSLPPGSTGVVGILHAGTSDMAIGLRADIDALPIQETGTAAYASRHPGRMHACGHDGHTTMLLGAADYLRQRRDFDGTIYLVFQPAEESGRGARAMIGAGLFADHPMRAVFGIHNWPGLPAGHFALTAGPIMASSSRVKVVFSGRGGHAALPRQAIDPMPAVFAMYGAMQTIVTRNLDASDPVVLSITQMGGSNNHCVIPDDAWLAGSLRTFRHKTLDRVCRRINEVASGVATTYGCTAAVEIEHTVPTTVNNDGMTAVCRSVLTDLVGASRLDTDFVPTPGAEDFAFMLQAVPGCYLMVGNGDGSDENAAAARPLHNPGYDFNDDVTATGVAYWISLARHCLPANGKSPLRTVRVT